MDFQTMYGEVAAQSGLDTSDTTIILPLLKRWVNIVQQDIAGRWPWNFLRGREVITTIPDYTTGTVSINAAGTAVTGSGTTFTATHADGTYYIQFSSAKDWYRVTARSSNTAITIETAYAQTTNLSAGTFVLRKFFYSLSSTADRIVDIRNYNTPLKLLETDPRTLDSASPLSQSSGISSMFVAYGYDASGNIQISPYPYPSDARLLEIRTIKRLSDLSATTDTSIIPIKWHHIVTFGANALAFAYLRKFDASQFWAAEYEKKINDMIKQQRTSEDTQPVLKAIDSNYRGGYVRLPDQYPAVGPRGY